MCSSVTWAITNLNSIFPLIHLLHELHHLNDQNLNGVGLPFALTHGIIKVNTPNMNNAHETMMHACGDPVKRLTSLHFDLPINK
jgi:hypothetical protein